MNRKRRVRSPGGPRPASIKVMQPAFTWRNRGRYLGGAQDGSSTADHRGSRRSPAGRMRFSSRPAARECQHVPGCVRQRVPCAGDHPESSGAAGYPGFRSPSGDGSRRSAASSPAGASDRPRRRPGRLHAQDGQRPLLRAGRAVLSRRPRASRDQRERRGNRLRGQRRLALELASSISSVDRASGFYPAGRGSESLMLHDALRGGGRLSPLQVKNRAPGPDRAQAPFG